LHRLHLLPRPVDISLFTFCHRPFAPRTSIP
jgi:hypothetical protein